MLQTAAKGVDSKFGKRRAAIRDTWLPAAKSLDGAETRFVVGNADDAVIMEKLRAEMQKFKDEFMHMDMRVRLPPGRLRAAALPCLPATRCRAPVPVRGDDV